MAPPHANLGDVGRLGVQSPRGADADECSSASSESCWGEMEDVGDEVVEWGVVRHPPQAGPDSVVNANLTQKVRELSRQKGIQRILQKRMMGSRREVWKVTAVMKRRSCFSTCQEQVQEAAFTSLDEVDLVEV